MAPPGEPRLRPDGYDIAQLKVPYELTIPRGLPAALLFEISSSLGIAVRVDVVIIALDDAVLPGLSDGRPVVLDLEVWAGV